MMLSNELDSLIKNNHDIILKQAHYFKKANPYISADLSDFYQEAVIATIEAKKYYDSNKGAWSNYLTKVIRHSLIKFACDNNTQLTTNPEAIKLCTNIYCLENQGFSVEEVCKQLKISHSRYLEVKILLTKEILSDNIMSENVNQYLITEMKEYLNDIENQILNYYLEECSVHEIAEKMGWSYEWARLRLNRLLNKLKTVYSRT